MGLHDDYFDAAAEILHEVHASAAALVVTVAPTDDESIEVDGWLGAIEETDVDGEGTNIRVRRRVRRCTARAMAVDVHDKPWTPTTETVVVAGGARWNVERIEGLGRPQYSLHLVRTGVINKQSASREAGRR